MKKVLALFIAMVVVQAISVVYKNKEIKEQVVNDVNQEDINSESVIDEEQNENTYVIDTNENGNKNETSGEIPKAESGEDKKEVENKTETITPVSYSSLSNEKCAWGFVRKSNDQQPEFYGPHSKILDENQGIYCGNKDKKVLYLTFDEGYENGYSASILDTLKEKGVSAAFFVTMPYVKQNPDLVKRMINEGHIVGNHTVNHPSLPEVTDNEKLKKEVMDLHDYVLENFGYEMKYLRPPKGEFSERTVRICLDLGYRHVLWSSAYADWDTSNQKGSDYAKKMICNYFHNGNVLLLHAVSKDNTNVLGDIIDDARNRGYEFKSIDAFEY